jgi:hypothetical protein
VTVKVARCTFFGTKPQELLVRTGEMYYTNPEAKICFWICMDNIHKNSMIERRAT